LPESVFDMDDMAATSEEETLGVLEDDAAAEAAAEAAAAEPDFPEPTYTEPQAAEPTLAEASLEFDDDIADVAAAAVGVASEPPPAEPAPTWAEILDDAIYLAHARCALVMDATGFVHESRGDWPKNTLDKVAARLMRGVEQAPAPPSADATQLIEIQLGSFFLTGLRAVLEGSPVVVGFLSQAPVKREVRPGLEAEVKRGTPL
jgi:hypothetical protein